MSVTLFIQEHNGDYNGHFEFADREVAEWAVYWIQRQEGFWPDGEILVKKHSRYHITPYTFEWKGGHSVFIPFHRIDRMEIQD